MPKGHSTMEERVAAIRRGLQAQRARYGPHYVEISTRYLNGIPMRTQQCLHCGVQLSITAMDYHILENHL